MVSHDSICFAFSSKGPEAVVSWTKQKLAVFPVKDAPICRRTYAINEKRTGRSEVATWS